jgi:integrase
MNSTVAALRFFFTQTLDRPDLSRKLIRLRYPRKLPPVLSAEEVARLLAAAKCLKHRAALAVAYGAGLRVAEVASLKVGDIDSARMLIRVERGKGGRYRHAMLSPDLLTLLRAWWQEGRRQGVMLPGGGCFPARTRASRSPPASPGASSTRLHRPSVLQNMSARTRCATASQRICSRMASTSA